MSDTPYLDQLIGSSTSNEETQKKQIGAPTTVVAPQASTVFPEDFEAVEADEAYPILGNVTGIGAEIGTGLYLTKRLHRSQQFLKWARGAKAASAAAIVTPEPVSTAAGLGTFALSEAAIWGVSNLIGQGIRKSFGVQDNISAGEVLASSVFGVGLVTKGGQKLISLGDGLAQMKAWGKGNELFVQGAKSFVSGATLGIAETALRQEVQILLNERENRDAVEYLIGGAAGGGFNTMFDVFSRTGKWGQAKAKQVTSRAKEALAKKADELEARAETVAPRARPKLRLEANRIRQSINLVDDLGQQLDTATEALNNPKPKEAPEAPATPKDAPEATPAPEAVATPEATPAPKPIIQFNKDGIPYKIEGTYIRFGDLPEGNSTNGWTGKTEEGHSVYKAYFDPKTKKYIILDNPYERGVATQDVLVAGKRKIYEVSGQRIGTGSDGEHLIDAGTSKQLKEIKRSDVVLKDEPFQDIDLQPLDKDAGFNMDDATMNFPEGFKLADYTYKKNDAGSFDIFKDGKIVDDELRLFGKSEIGTEDVAKDIIKRNIDEDLLDFKIAQKDTPEATPAPKTPEVAPEETPFKDYKESEAYAEEIGGLGINRSPRVDASLVDLTDEALKTQKRQAEKALDKLESGKMETRKEVDEVATAQDRLSEFENEEFRRRFKVNIDEYKAAASDEERAEIMDFIKSELFDDIGRSKDEDFKLAFLMDQLSKEGLFNDFMVANKRELQAKIDADPEFQASYEEVFKGDLLDKLNRGKALLEDASSVRLASKTPETPIKPQDTLEGSTINTPALTGPIDESLAAIDEILKGDRTGGKGARVTRKVKSHFRAVAQEFFGDINELIKNKDIETARKILGRIDKYIEFDRAISKKDYAQGSELQANTRQAMDNGTTDYAAGITAAGNKRTEDLIVLKGMLQKLVDEDVAIDTKLAKTVAGDAKKKAEGAPKLSKEEKLDAIADQVAKTFTGERVGVFQQAVDGYFTLRLTQMLNQAKTAFVGVPSATFMSVVRPIINTPYNIAKSLQLKDVSVSRRIQYAAADISGTYEYVRMITKHLGDTLRSSKDTILNKGDSNFLYRDRNAYIKDQLAEASEPNHRVKKRIKQAQRRQDVVEAKSELARKYLKAKATILNSKPAQVPAFFFDYGISLIGGLEEISLIAHSMRAARAKGIKKAIDDGADSVWKSSEEYMEAAFDRSRGGLQAKYDPEYADIFNTARRDHFRAMDLDPKDIRKDLTDGLISALVKTSGNMDEA